MPIYEGKTLEEDEFNKLDEKIKKEFEEKSNIVQDQIMSTISEIKILEKQSETKIQEWQSNISLLTVNVHINYIKSKYKRNKIISQFLDNIKKDIVKNVHLFLEPTSHSSASATQQQPPFPVLHKEANKPWLNYRVNLFVDNSKLEGAPVIMDSNYTFQNLFGKLEYENYMGTLRTDYTMLKAGLLHKANGGYIIFQAEDLLTNPVCYENLKRALRIKELSIDNSLEQRAAMVWFL